MMDRWMRLGRGDRKGGGGLLWMRVLKRMAFGWMNPVRVL